MPSTQACPSDEWNQPFTGADPARERGSAATDHKRSRSEPAANSGDSVAIVPAAPACAQLARAQCESSDQASALGAIFSQYGAELRAFLRARTSSRNSMEEVYSSFSEDVWRGLPGLRAQRQVRAWLYVVARNALSRHLRRRLRWRDHHVAGEPDEVSFEPRSSHTGPRFSTLAPLLSDVPEADRWLLEQRVLGAKAFGEIARLNTPADATEVEVARESARLRKRFQLLVRGLRARVAELRDEGADTASSTHESATHKAQH